MAKYKLFLSLILSIAIVVTMSPTLYASCNDDILQPKDTITIDANEHAADPTNSTRFICLDCEWFAVFHCNGDYRLVEGFEHNNKCYVVYYAATGTERCVQCQKDVYDYTEYDGGGWHDCFQLHSACSPGRVDTCPDTFW